MPAFVTGALLAGFIAGTAATIGTAAGFALAFSWGAFGSTLVLGGLAKAFTKKPETPQFGAQGRMVTVRQSIPARQVVIGETRAGAAVTFMHFSRSGAAWFVEDAFIPSGVTYTVKHAAAYVATESVRAIAETGEGSVFESFTEVASSPAPGQYSVAAGVYTFNAADVGRQLRIVYQHSSLTTDVLHLVLTFTGHPIAGFVTVLFDDEVVPLDAAGNATGKYGGHVRIQQSNGTEGTAQPFPDLVAESGGAWSAQHLQAGCAKLYARLVMNPDLFPQGVPNITAELRGALVFDPRTDTTIWSNNAGVAMAHYFTNTDYGLGADYSVEIHDTDCVSAANSCDEGVSLATATTTFTADASLDRIALAAGSRQILTGMGVRVSSSGSLPAGLSAGTTYYAIRRTGGYGLATSLANARAGGAIDITSAGSGIHTLTYWDEPRYTANGAFLTSEKPVDVITRFAAAMAGSAVTVGDQWHINAGVYHTPTVTLDEDDLAGGNVIQAHVPSREGGNGVKGIFSNPDVNWQADDFPAIAGASYLAADGGERNWRDLDLTAFVTSGTQAQRLGKIDLLRARQSLTESAPFKITAWPTIPGRTVARTDAQLGWSAKAFEIQSMALEIVEGDDHNTVIQVRQQLRETAAAVYDWSSSEEQAVDIAPNTNLPDVGDVAAPGNPSITEELYETRDGRGVAAKAIVIWSPSLYVFDKSYQLEYQATTAIASDWIVLPPVKDTRVELTDLAPGRYNFRVRTIGAGGASSLYGYALDREIQGLAAPPAAPVITGLQTVGGLGIITVEPHPDLDVRRGGRWRIRHVQDGSVVAWDTSFSIGDPDSWLGDQTILVVPLKPGTYLVRAEDAMGVQSEAYAQIETKQASVHTYSTLSTLQEDAAFTGTHSGTAASGGVLTLGGLGMFDDIPDLDAVINLDGYGGIGPQGTYGFAAGYDHGSVGKLRLTGQIQGVIVNLNDLIDDRTGNIDDWFDFDGTAEIGGSSGDAWIEFRETDDNPSGSPVWSDWKRLDSSEAEARGLQFRAKLSADDPAYRPEVTLMRVKIEALA